MGICYLSKISSRFSSTFLRFFFFDQNFKFVGFICRVGIQ